METENQIIDPLFEKVEKYGSTSFKLLKLRSIDFIAESMSTVLSKLLLGSIFLIFIIFFNVGLSLWIGLLLGKTYLGFIFTSLGFLVVGLILLFIKEFLKSKFYNSIVVKLTD